MKKIQLILVSALFMACTSTSKKQINLPYTQADFETVINEKKTDLFVMENKNGMTVTLTNYGGKIVSIYVPDKEGNFADVILGFNSIDDYQKYGASHGAIVGPFANRIANAQFTIDGTTYQLPVNNGEACLHSGPDSWYRQVWDASQDGNATTFSLESPDGEYGFPGNKKVKVTYTLTDKDELKINYHLTTDKACHFNLTNHGYYNLRGEGNGDVLNHILVINADKLTAVSTETMIPTGEIINIKGTAFDFTSPHAIGSRIDGPDPYLQKVGGYDFNYVINKPEDNLGFAASAFEPESGRYMEVFTTEPGVQLYTANHFEGKEIGKSGQPYNVHTGFCLETQHFPDSPNQPDFPSTLLKPGEELNSTTIYKFSVKE